MPPGDHTVTGGVLPFKQDGTSSISVTLPNNFGCVEVMLLVGVPSVGRNTRMARFPAKDAGNKIPYVNVEGVGGNWKGFAPMLFCCP